MRAAMRSARWQLGGAAVVVAFAWAVVWQSGSRPAVDGTGHDVVVLAPAARWPVEPADSPGPIVAARVTDPRSGIAMARDLREATDLRRFAISAAQHPESGGVTYARYATEL